MTLIFFNFNVLIIQNWKHTFPFQVRSVCDGYQKKANYCSCLRKLESGQQKKKKTSSDQAPAIISFQIENGKFIEKNDKFIVSLG